MAGAAAWSDEWMDQFVAAGADSQTLQQLFVTGGDGLDAAGLQERLAQVKQQVNQIYTQFDAKYPGERATLTRTKMTPTQITDLTAKAVSGEIGKREIMAKVDEAYGASGTGQMRSMFGDMVPYSFIPGWGAISTGLGLANGAIHGDLATSRNPVSNRQLFGTGMDQVMTPLMGAFGAVTLYNLASEQKHLRAGHAAAIKPGSMEALIAEHQGVKLQAARPFNPFNRDNRVLAALSKYQDYKLGVEKLESVARAKAAAGIPAGEIGAQAQVARDFLTKWERGTVPVLSDPVMNLTKFGIFPQTRASILQRNKVAIGIRNVAGLQSAVIDTRASGPILAAQGAATGTQFAKGETLRRLLELHGEPGATAVTKESIPKLREIMVARSTRDLMTSTRESAALIGERGPLAKINGFFRPNALEDGLKAIKRLDAGKVGLPSGLKALSHMQKVGILAGGLAVIGGGFMLMKRMGGGGEQAAAEDAPGAGAPAPAGAAPAAPGRATPS
jgi:hypothetical protein